jgi:DnaK suppressor protein
MQTERKEIVEAIRLRLRNHRELLLQRLNHVESEQPEHGPQATTDRSLRQFDELDDTDRALQRIREGTYGVCRRCQGEIAGERLEVLPFATVCVRCQLQQRLSAEPDSESST